MRKRRHPPEIGITRNLISLERGDDELLLANSWHLRPLHIRKGRESVRRFLDAVGELGTEKKVLEAFPGDAALLAMLKDHRIVVGPEPEAEGPVPWVPRSGERWRNKESISLYLLLSQSCNLGCVYCLNGKRTYAKEHRPKMRADVAFRSVERCLDALAGDGVLELVFFGGEPLLNWPLAKKTILHCEKLLAGVHRGKRIRYSVTSNLTRLPSDLVAWAKRHEIGFLCDVDGTADIHDRCRPYRSGAKSHARTTANIRRLVDAGLRVSLRSTVTSLNDARMVETAVHHKEIGGAASAFVPVNPVNSDEDMLAESLLPDTDRMIDGLERVYRSGVWDTPNLFPFSVYASKVSPGARAVTGCGAPYGNTPVVDVSGGVYPCIYLVGIEKYFLGNIAEAGCPDPEVLDRMERILHVDNIEECRGCPWRYLCGGGCPVGRLTVEGNPLVSPAALAYTRRVNCDYTKKILELLLWEKAGEAASSAEAAGSGATTVAIDNTLNC
jgi:uncharacterized protein